MKKNNKDLVSDETFLIGIYYFFENVFLQDNEIKTGKRQEGSFLEAIIYALDKASRISSKNK